MGYTTKFQGQFDLDKPLDDETYRFLFRLANTRRMKRALGPEYGVEGEFYVDGPGTIEGEWEAMERESDTYHADKRSQWGTYNRGEFVPKLTSIIEYNKPPSTQPGLWCQWIPSEDRLHLTWDGGEKFYSYVEWLEYIIKNILIPRGYVLSGEVDWMGEDQRGDNGIIRVIDNVVTTEPGAGRMEITDEDEDD
jgi:hypothetical protein